ncbi:hypothetical protein LZ30DRAFT_440909 [Colletotrichum cereale]|nr:hypothetical protein LZ30DRAFT_440909 [Colletotrichum cereale]
MKMQSAISNQQSATARGHRSTCHSRSPSGSSPSRLSASAPATPPSSRRTFPSGPAPRHCRKGKLNCGSHLRAPSFSTSPTVAPIRTSHHHTPHYRAPTHLPTMPPGVMYHAISPWPHCDRQPTSPHQALAELSSSHLEGTCPKAFHQLCIL